MIEEDKIRGMAGRIKELLEGPEENAGFIILVYDKEESDSNAAFVTNCNRGQVIDYLAKTLSYLASPDEKNTVDEQSHTLTEIH